jgi:TrpR family trp operon transcriptional repressor
LYNVSIDRNKEGEMTDLNDLTKILAQVDDAGQIREFFTSIFTEKEISMLVSRWELVCLIDQGVSQRTIARKLGLSLCKITRGSRELKKPDSVLKKFIDLQKKQ